MCERRDQRAAARLAVGVLELDALERRRRLDREVVAALDDARLERARERDDLEHRARRLRRGERDAGQRQHLAVARPHRGDAAVAAGERLDRRALDVGVDRRAHVAPAPRRRRRQHARAGEELAAGRAGELGVELALEAGEADRRAVRHALRRQLLGPLGRRRPDPAGDLGGERVELRQPRLAVRDPRAVAGLDRRALGHLRVAAQLLARSQPGEHEVRLPCHGRLAVVALAERERDCRAQVAEDPRADVERHGDRVVLRLPGPRRSQPGDRRGRLRAPVRAGEPLQRPLLARLGREHRVHGRVVAALPRRREPNREPAFGGLVTAAGYEAARERPDGEDQQRDEAAQPRAAPLGRGAGLGHGAQPKSRSRCGAVQRAWRAAGVGSHSD